MTLIRANQISTPAGAFFNNGVNPVGAALRHPNRAFFGESHTHGQQLDGSVTGGSWLQSFVAGGRTITEWDYFEDQTRVSSVSNFGIALAGVTRVGGANVDGIGVVGVAVNDGNARDCWGAYIDAVGSSATSGVTNGAEVNIANIVGTSPVGGMTPYRLYQSRMYGGLIVASGSDAAAIGGRSFASDWGINIANNGGAFWTGINFRFDAIMREGVADDTQTPMNTGYARAIAMAHDQGLSWYSRDPSGAVNSGTQEEAVRLYSSVDSAAVRWEMVFSNDVWALNDRVSPSGAQFQVGYLADAAANLFMRPATLGLSPAVEVRGVNANIPLTLAPKGTGWVTYGALANCPEYANSAAAGAAGLNIGAIFRTGETLKVRIA